ncbi:proline dehydrogenase 2, mitochondrial-like [Punica granatum]|uniref:Proline dehydrogenase n=2 Tax=Punica granatum TaxID=22663 RepID=A0A6P8DA28_PUNGR|nr:proline dehydrogenase 2, mitochondrial-like [Punica granatum]
MATRIAASPKKTLVDHIRVLARPLNSVPSSITAAVPGQFAAFEEKHEPAPTGPSPPIDLSDPGRLFASVPTTRLIHSVANLHAAAVDPLVDLGIKVMTSRLVTGTGPARDIVIGAVKRTFYKHFCGGEDTVEAAETVRQLNEAGLRGMLDYAVEDAEDNPSCDQNLEAFLQTVASTKTLPQGCVSFVIVKITAICPISLLQRVADLLRWQKKNPEFHLPWKHYSYPILSDSTPVYHTPAEPEPLTPQEEANLLLAQERLRRIGKKCEEYNIPLCIDAEYTAVQPAIDYFTYSSAMEHNKHEPIIYGTLQAYLKDAKERLLLKSEAAQKMGILMGVKLVRGAYMTTEAKLAHSLGYESPIHNSLQETHDCFNNCASFMLEKIAGGSGAVVLATHNVESGQLAAMKARDMGMSSGNHRLEFAQLYGMADSFSFGLKNAGFRVSKYMPFGPVDQVMPYLLRRAEENRGLLSASTLDRQLMRKELWRRLRTAIL